MKQILVGAFVAMSIQLARGAETPALIDRPAPGNGQGTDLSTQRLGAISGELGLEIVEHRFGRA
jgi:hypothetical protein